MNTLRYRLRSCRRHPACKYMDQMLLEPPHRGAIDFEFPALIVFVCEAEAIVWSTTKKVRSSFNMNFVRRTNDEIAAVGGHGTLIAGSRRFDLMFNSTRMQRKTASQLWLV